MRNRLMAIIGVSALFVGAFAIRAGAAAGPAAGRSRAIAAAYQWPAACTPPVIINQNDQDAGVGIVSQDFTDPGGVNDIFDSQGADDFTVGARGATVNCFRVNRSPR